MVLYRRINDKSLQVILFPLISNLVVDSYSLYRGSHGLNSFLAFNIGLLVEATALYIFLYKILINKVIKKVILFLALFFIVFWGIQFFSKGSLDFLDTCTTIENISFLALALYYYYEQLIKGTSSVVYQEPRFWVITAFLIITAGTFFLTLYTPFLNKLQELKYYMLNYVFTIIRTILLSAAMFLKHNNSPKQKFKLT